jgi:hypothetical protein
MAAKRLLYKVRLYNRKYFFINHSTSIFDIRTDFGPYIEVFRISRSGYRSFTVYVYSKTVQPFECRTNPKAVKSWIRKPNRIRLSDGNCTAHFQSRFLNGNDHSISKQIVRFSNDIAAILFFFHSKSTPDHFFPIAWTVSYKRKYFLGYFICIKWSKLVTILKPDISVWTTK